MGASSSTSAKHTMSVGEMARPQTTAAIPKVTSEPALRKNSGVRTAIPREPTTSWRRRGMAGWRQPYVRPATRLPEAYNARITPAAGSRPSSSLRAIVTTSTQPKIPPRKNETRMRTCSQTPARALPVPPRAPTSGGSLRRWARKSRPPNKPMAATASSAEGGLKCTAQRVTAGGPSTKMSSSSTDSQEYAVRRPSEPSRAADHRERTKEPMVGSAPATSAATNSVQAGAPRSASRTSATSPDAKITSWGVVTRRWP